jgi:hypothetical protein
MAELDDDGFLGIDGQRKRAGKQADQKFGNFHFFSSGWLGREISGNDCVEVSRKSCFLRIVDFHIRENRQPAQSSG